MGFVRTQRKSERERLTATFGLRNKVEAVPVSVAVALSV